MPSLITPTLVEKLLVDTPKCDPTRFVKHAVNASVTIWKNPQSQAGQKIEEKPKGLLAKIFSAVCPVIEKSVLISLDFLYTINVAGKNQIKLALKNYMIFDGYEMVTLFTGSDHPKIRAMVTPEILDNMMMQYNRYKEQPFLKSWNKIVDTLKTSKF